MTEQFRPRYSDPKGKINTSVYPLTAKARIVEGHRQLKSLVGMDKRTKAAKQVYEYIDGLSISDHDKLGNKLVGDLLISAIKVHGPGLFVM